MREQPNLKTAILARSGVIQTAVVLLLGLPLALFVINGLFARPLADDFCYLPVAQSLSVWDFMVERYNNWTSTPFLWGVLAAAAKLGANVVPLIALIAVPLWLFSLYWMLLELFRWINLSQPRFSALVLSMAVLNAILSGLPNIYQTLYWLSGAVTYITPWIVFTCFLALTLRTARGSVARHWLPLIGGLAALLNFIAAGFVPTFTAPQIVVLVLMIAATLRFAKAQQRRHLLAILIPALVAATIMLLLILLGPGTAVRQSAQIERLPWLTIIGQTLAFTASIIAGGLLLYGPWALLLVWIMAGIGAYGRYPVQTATIRRYRWYLLGGIATITLILIGVPVFAAVYVTGESLPARGFTVTVPILVMSVAAVGAVMGLSLRTTATPAALTRPLRLVVAMAIAAGVGLTSINILSTTERLSISAREWDTRDNYLRTAGFDATSDVLVQRYTVDLAELAWLEPSAPIPGAA